MEPVCPLNSQTKKKNWIKTIYIIQHIQYSIDIYLRISYQRWELQMVPFSRSLLELIFRESQGKVVEKELGLDDQRKLTYMIRNYVK